MKYPFIKDFVDGGLERGCDKGYKMTNEELILLSQVRRKVKEKPEFVGHIVSIMTQGLVESVKEYQHMAADMETLASVAISMAGEKRVTKKTKEYFEKLKSAIFTNIQKPVVLLFRS